MNGMQSALGPATVVALVFVSAGCLHYDVYEPKIAIAVEGPVWEARTGLASAALASWKGKFGVVRLAVRADDPHTPVHVDVDLSCDAKVSVERQPRSRSPAGMARICARDHAKEEYVRTRPSQPFGFGEMIAVPSGQAVILEFDPEPLLARGKLKVGDNVAFDIRIESGGAVDVCPVRFRVLEIKTPSEWNWRTK